MENPQLMGYEPEHGAKLITNLLRKEDKIIVWTWEKGNEKLEHF